MSNIQVFTIFFDGVVNGMHPFVCLPILYFLDHVGFTGGSQFKGAVRLEFGLHLRCERDLSAEVIVILVIFETGFRGKDECARLLHEKTILLS